MNNNYFNNRQNIKITIYTWNDFIEKEVRFVEFLIFTVKQEQKRTKTSSTIDTFLVHT